MVSQNPSNLGVTLDEQLCYAAKNNLLLQIHSPLHQEDMPIPNPGGGAGSGPGSCHLTSQLWQLAPGWCADVPSDLCSSSTMLVFTYIFHNIPLLCTLHWLPVATPIRFKTELFAYRAANGSGPSYMKEMVKPYTPACLLLPISLIFPHYEEGPATAQQNQDCLLSWPPLWWNKLPTQQKTNKSSFTDWKLTLAHKNKNALAVVLKFTSEAGQHIWRNFWLYPHGWMNVVHSIVSCQKSVIGC